MCTGHNPHRRKAVTSLIGAVGLISLPAFAQQGAPVAIPPREINLPDLSAAGSETLNPADLMRFRYELMAMFERGSLTPLGVRTAVLSEPVVQAFTRDVLQRLAPDNTAINYVLANPQFGASAYVGGVVVTHAGLWMQCDSLSAVAAVLAHEWVHINNHHIARMLAKAESSQWLSILGALAGIATIGSNAQVGQALILGAQALPARTGLVFSRDMEEEADREGMVLLARAGFEPQGMVRTMEILNQYRGFGKDSTDTLPFLLTHPLTDERLQSARRRVLAVSSESSLIHLGSSVRPLSELNAEFDWVRYALSDPAQRPQQRLALSQRYSGRAWFASALAAFNAPITGEESALMGAFLKDTRLTPLLLALFARLFSGEASVMYLRGCVERYPNHSLLQAMLAQMLWRQAPETKLAKNLINLVLNNSPWLGKVGEPNLWDDVLISAFQRTEDSLGESYFLARKSLTIGHYDLAEQAIGRAERILATLQNEVNPPVLVRALPRLNNDMQEMAAIVRLLKTPV